MGITFFNYTLIVNINVVGRPVERIDIIDENLKTNEQGEQYVVVRPDASGNITYQINYCVYPDNATNKSVTFMYDKQNLGVSVDKDGKVSFASGSTAITVQIISDDGNASTSLTIFARKS